MSVAVRFPAHASTLPCNDAHQTQVLVAAKVFHPDEKLWLLREPGSGVRHYTEAYLHEQGIVPQQTLVVDSNQSIIGLLTQGIGKTLMSEGVLPSEVVRQSLGQQYHRHFYLIGLDRQPNLQLADLRNVLSRVMLQ